MNAALILLLVNVIFGAWDTLWYHEYKTRLVHHLASTRPELRLHAARDGVYTCLYGSLAIYRPQGLYVYIVGAMLVAEIMITLTDFVVEDRDRGAIGGMVAGERILHTLMAIVYGAMLTFLIPELISGARLPTALVINDAWVLLRLGAGVAAIGIGMSGIRDTVALTRNSATMRPIRRVAG